MIAISLRKCMKDVLRVAAIAILCSSAPGCFFGVPLAENMVGAIVGSGADTLTQPKLTDAGQHVLMGDAGTVEACKWIGDEEIRISRFNGSGHLKTDAARSSEEWIVARNSAPHMGGDAIVETSRPNANNMNFDVYRCSDESGPTQAAPDPNASIRSTP